jgi:hypothetical protein
MAATRFSRLTVTMFSRILARMNGDTAYAIGAAKADRQILADESLSGLSPWTLAQLPPAPNPHGVGWLSAVGPGVIVLGVSIGSGEFLLGPAVFVRHGLTLLWAVTAAVLLQTIFNTEVMRYTLATGEPVCTGFMRSRPTSTVWAWFYAGLYFAQIGWPVWAGTASGAIFFLLTQRMPSPNDSESIFAIAVVTFLGCVAILSLGRRIVRTLEVLNWVLVTTTLAALLVLAVAFVPRDVWIGSASGLVGFDVATGSFEFLPAGADLVLISGLVAFAGSGGVTNLTLSNWARDRGYGMAGHAGFIAGLTSTRESVAESGFMFKASESAMREWRRWWRIVAADQWGVFCAGAILGMVLPAVLYVTFIPRGNNIEGLGISAALASAISGKAGFGLGSAIAFLAAWILFKTQLDNLDGLVRATTDILWSGSARIRRWRGGDIQRLYYCVLIAMVCWGLIALRLAQPTVLLRLSANIAGIVFVVTPLHLLYVNTRLLPAHVRPPLWRRAALIGMSMFYAVFSTLSLLSLLR